MLVWISVGFLKALSQWCPRYHSLEIVSAMEASRLKYAWSQPSGTSARVPTLIMFTTTGDDLGWRGINIRFFLTQGVLPYPEYQFLFIVNGCHHFQLSTELLNTPNFEMLERPNVCMDAGGWLDGWRHMEAKNRRFERIVFLNSSVRGPFRPRWVYSDWDWVSAFTSQLSDRVKLVGTSVNCGTGLEKEGIKESRKLGLHLQSMALATDREGFECCVRPALEVPKCDGDHPLSRDDVILHREVGITRRVLAAGHSVAPMMLAWEGVDINIENADAVNAQCKKIQGSFGKPDPYYTGAYGGVSLSPLELMFFKTNRKVETPLLDAYTRWAAGDDIFMPYTRSSVPAHAPYTIGEKTKGIGCVPLDNRLVS